MIYPKGIILNKHNIDNQVVTHYFNFIFKGYQYSQAVTYHFNFIFSGNEYTYLDLYSSEIKMILESYQLGNNSTLSGNNNVNLNSDEYIRISSRKKRCSRQERAIDFMESGCNKINELYEKIKKKSIIKEKNRPKILKDEQRMSSYVITNLNHFFMNLRNYTQRVSF